MCGLPKNVWVLLRRPIVTDWLPPSLNCSYLKLDAVGQERVGAPPIEEEAVGVVEVLRVAVLARALHVLGRLDHGGRDCLWGINYNFTISLTKWKTHIMDRWR